MPDTIAYSELVAMLRGAVELIRANQDTLSELDSHGGDGDHGTTMVRAMNKLEEAMNAAQGESMKSMLSDIAWAVMGVDGGATGPLFGTLFMAMSDSVADQTALDCPAVAAMFEAGLAGVNKRSKARVGDKTMVDALVPGVQAVRAAADSGATVSEALTQAAQASKEGAESTVALQARFGRAKNIGEKSAGYQDPGATSVSLMFKGFSEGVCSNA